MKNECCEKCFWYEKYNCLECGRFPKGLTISFPDEHCCGEFKLKEENNVR